MVCRSITSLARLCIVTTLVVLGTTALLQRYRSAPAAAAGSSVELFAWGYNGFGELGNGTTADQRYASVGFAPSGVTPTATAMGGVVVTPLARTGTSMRG